jgi:alpha-maltose-1-phosphate synthase
VNGSARREPRPSGRARPAVGGRSFPTMRLLYLHYGPQSGVTASITAALSGGGAEVLLANPAERFLYQLVPGWKVPNPRPVVVRAVAEAVRTHGRRWKPYYLHTRFAFDHLSEVAGQAIRAAAPDAVIQAGVLFSPGRRPETPYHLYLDHTRAIAERYEATPGLPPPVPYEPGWRVREREVYRGAAAIFAMSEYVRRSLRDDYGVDPARVHVVGAGPNVSPEPSDLGLARDPVILFVGKTFGPKGGPELLEAFARVRRAHPAARLAIVASSAPAALPPGATFHGLLGKEALARLYATASIFALPTRREAFGLSFVEAMAFGLPAIGSRIEAIPEIIADGETGLLVPPGDPTALAEAISALLGDPARARRMGAAGRARVAGRFSWRLAAESMLEAMGARDLDAPASAG